MYFRQAKFATMDKATKTLKKNGAEIEDKVQNLLNVVQSTQGLGCDVKDLKDLGKRNCVIEKRVLDYKLDKGPRFSLTFTKMTTDITPEMMVQPRLRSCLTVLHLSPHLTSPHLRSHRCHSDCLCCAGKRHVEDSRIQKV